MKMSYVDIDLWTVTQNLRYLIKSCVCGVWAKCLASQRSVWCLSKLFGVSAKCLASHQILTKCRASQRVRILDHNGSFFEILIICNYCNFGVSRFRRFENVESWKVTLSWQLGPSHICGVWAKVGPSKTTILGRVMYPYSSEKTPILRPFLGRSRYYNPTRRRYRGGTQSYYNTYCGPNPVGGTP